ncbi:MAG: Uma2 family endonuclease [Chitinophagaceae bacterium]
MEILSPGTAQYDLGEKKDVYERCGVTEYWTVDPEDNEAVCFYLVNAEYEEIFRSNGVIESKLLECRISF